MTDDEMNNDLLQFTADIVAAMVSNNTVAAGDVAELIANTYAALAGIGKTVEPEPIAKEPAVSIKASVKNDYIVCLEDGAKLKMLKRYLMTNYQMTPADYRAKWGLPRDYPMVAPAYSDQRRTLAKSIGLGNSRKGDVADAAPEPVKAAVAKVVKASEPKKRARPSKVPAEPAGDQEDQDSNIVREPVED